MNHSVIIRALPRMRKDLTMRSGRFVTLMISACLAANCSGSGAADRDSAGQTVTATTEECNILTADDVRGITGVTVTRIARDPLKGAGGTCVNFASADRLPYLGVNRLDSRSDYGASIKAVPSDVYPTQEPLQGVGDEGVLFKGPGNLRYLVAWRGQSGVVLFPLGRGQSMTDAQLRQLAVQGLTGASRTRSLRGSASAAWGRRPSRG